MLSLATLPLRHSAVPLALVCARAAIVNANANANA